MTETPANASALNVLIVEDHADSGYVLQEFMQFLGYRATLAGSAEEAHSLLGATPPDVAFVDILLPGSSGHEFAAELRQRFGNSVFLVALTGWVGPAAETKAKLAGFDAFLAKPVSLDDIRTLLSARVGALRSEST